MPSYTNFYENAKEAELRLKNTVVLYDGEPYLVLAICDHKPDGIYRIYLDPIGPEMTSSQGYGIPYNGPWPDQYNNRGDALDAWMTNHPAQNKILRKMMNSPAFNKFRPFPLGMTNLKGNVYYLERHPTRKTEQGLTDGMLVCNPVTFDKTARAASPGLCSAQMRDTIMGNYPSAQECLTKLLHPENINNAVAFNRSFAFVRGPIDTVFLAYKSDIVGLLPSSSLASLKLAKKFNYTKEAIEELNLFGSLII